MQRLQSILSDIKSVGEFLLQPTPSTVGSGVVFTAGVAVIFESFKWAFLLICISAMWGIAAWLVSAQLRKYRPTPTTSKKPEKIEKYKAAMRSYRRWQFSIPILILFVPSGFLAGHLWPKDPIPPSPPSVALFLDDCGYPGFPLTIPKGTVAHVLLINPSILKHSRNNIAEVSDIWAPNDKDRIWPTDDEAPILPAHQVGGPLARGTTRALECSVLKYGEGTVDDVVIPLTFWAGTYNLLIDPLESSGELSRFKFYLVNGCYAAMKPGTYYMDESSPMVSNFPHSASLHVLGESGRREVPMKVSYRANEMNFIFLLESHRKWSNLDPCY